MRRRRGTEILARGALWSGLVVVGASAATGQDLPVSVTPSANSPSQVQVTTSVGGGATALVERRNLSSSIAWRTYHKMGWESLRAGDTTMAKTLFESGLKEAQRVGQDDRRVAASYNDLGWVFLQMGRPDDAEPLVRWALNTRVALLGAVHPEVGDSLTLLAKVETARKNYEEAEKAARSAVTIYFHSSTGETDRFPPYSLDILGEVVEARGDLVQAQALYQRALDIRNKSLGITYFDPGISEEDVAVSYRRLGGLLRRQGNTEGADAMDQRAELIESALRAGQGLGAPAGGGLNDPAGDPAAPGAAAPAPGVGNFGP
jgi:tetratricopeptide (TPR) repeat protein